MTETEVLDFIKTTQWCEQAKMAFIDSKNIRKEVNITLGINPGLLTSVTNDFGYKYVDNGKGMLYEYVGSKINKGFYLALFFLVEDRGSRGWCPCIIPISEIISLAKKKGKKINIKQTIWR